MKFTFIPGDRIKYTSVRWINHIKYNNKVYSTIVKKGWFIKYVNKPNYLGIERAKIILDGNKSPSIVLVNKLNLINE